MVVVLYLLIRPEESLAVPRRTFHGDEPDIALRHLSGHASHVADDAINFVILSLKEVETVLYADSSQCFEFLAEQRLVLGLRYIIGKHHEHGV